MAQVTRDQFLQLLKQAPGVTPEQLRDKLLERGNTLVGYTPPDSLNVIQKQQQQGKRGIGGFLLGGIKGLASTISNIEGLGQKGLEKITGIVSKTPTLTETLGDTIKPQGTAEKIGFGTEQVAEFFVPSGAGVKAAKAAEAASGASKLAKVAGLGAKVATEGATSAGLVGLQGGDEKDIMTAGIIGGGFTVLGQGISSLLSKAPKTAWSSILKRTPSDVAKNPKLTAQAVETGLTGGTRDAIKNKAASAIQDIEVALDDVLSQSKGKIGTLKIAPYLDELRKTYRLIPGEETSVQMIDNVMENLLKKKSLTVLEANELKRAIYQNISNSYGKGLLDNPVKTAAQKQIARGLKTEIEKVIPEVKGLNEKQAVYIGVKKAIEKTLARTEGKGIAGTGIGLYDLMLGGAVGIPTGGAAGLAAIVGKKVLESPLVLSNTAKLLNYFNSISPTKKLMFYEALKGLTVKSTNTVLSKEKDDE